MKNLEDLIKAIIVLVMGVAIMSSLSSLEGGESFANLGKFLIIMAFIIGIISFFIPLIKRYL